MSVHRITIKFLSTVFLVFFACNAVAETFSRGFYFSGGFAKHSISDFPIHSEPEDFRLNGALFKVGYDIAPYFAVEGHAGLTAKGNYYWYNNLGQAVGEYDLQAEHGALYARANWRLKNVMLYGLLGYGYYNVVVDDKVVGNYDVSYSVRRDGFTFGVGMDLFGTRRGALSLNWLQLINEEDKYGDKLDVNAVYLGITYYLKPQKTSHPLD